MSNHVLHLENTEKSALRVSGSSGADQSGGISPGAFSDVAIGGDEVLLRKIIQVNSAAILIDEVGKANSSSKPGPYLVDADAWFVTETSMENKVQCDTDLTCNLIDDEHRKLNSLIDSPGNQVPEVFHKTSESKISEEIEDDVKVCDICGDTGQEELLAICTRCSDGAEHIYCMRAMLDEVPQDDWLCEGCQLEVESKKQKADESQAKNVAPEAPSLNRRLEKLEKETANSGFKGPSEVDQITHISTKKSEENADDASLIKRKISESSCGLKEPADSRKRTLLTHESSFNNLDVEKAKQVGTSNPSIEPPVRGLLTKSTSFNNSKIPKVKQLINDVPQKQKNAKECSFSNLRKGGLEAKFASFKHVNSFSSNDTVNKMKSSDNTSLAELPIGEKQVKERIPTAIKSTPILGRPSISVSPPISGTCVPSPKGDVDAVQNDAKNSRIHITDRSSVGIGQGSDIGSNLGHSEMKKSHFIKSDGNALSNGLSKPVDQKTGQLLSKGTVSSMSRTLRCQRCNEAGHPSQFCAVDKVRVTALKPSIEQNPKEGSDNKSKLKEPVEVASLLTGTQIGAGSPDCSEDYRKSSFVWNCELGSEVFLSSSVSRVRNGPEMRKSFAYPIKGSAAIDTMLKPRLADETSASRERDADANLGMLDELKPKMQIYSSQAPVLVDEFRDLIIPELEHIWQGGFEVLNKWRHPKLCPGVQAHLSSRVSPKVLEAVEKFPSSIKLEEVPRQGSWPSQFEENGPKEEHIALFFFAKDIESYEKNYCKLLEIILKDDLALRCGDIDGVELLIFPSNLLPQNSQRWNSLYFLWGVFKCKGQSCSEDLPDYNLKKDIMVPDQPTTSTTFAVSVSPGAVNNGTLPEMGFLELTHSGLHGIASPESRHGICDRHQFCIEKSSHQASADDKLPEDHNSCSALQRDSSKNKSQTPSFLSTHSPSVHRMVMEQFQLKNNVSPSDNFSKDGGDFGNLIRGNVGVQANSVDRVSATDSVSPNHRDDESTSEAKNKLRDGLGQSEPALDVGSEDLMDINTSNMENMVDLRSKRKHGNSSPMEAIQWESTSDHTSLDDNTVRKKMKLVSVEHPACSYKEDTVDGGSSSNDVIDNEKITDMSTSAERYFFPVDLGPAKFLKSKAPETLINALTSDEDESPKCDAPDLELALGDNKKAPKKFPLPSLCLTAGEKTQLGWLPALSAEDANGATASLSLSLALPASDKTQASKSNSRTEKHLFGKPFASMWQL